MDIKREDITLKDRTKGISADEFAGGSYYYSEGISSGYNTKGFELGSYLRKSILNTRDNGYPVALSPSVNYGALAFTKDGMIEAEEFYNGSSSGTGDTGWGGALFSRYGITNYYEYVNGITYGNLAVGITPLYIDVVDVTDPPFNPADELLSEPLFDNGGADWTLGTGWTITDNGAEHTTGETGTLSATINFGTPPTSADYVRVAIKVADSTTGRLAVSLDNPSTEYDIKSANGWLTLTFRCSASTTSLVITPTSTFNGVIKAVNVHLYDNTKVTLRKATLYNGQANQPHPALVWEGDLYVACGNYVNIFSLADWGRTYKELVDRNFTIVSMTQQAGNIIIWATDGFDSRQYYWNGVDAVATEVIEWKGLIIQGVTGTETISYVLTASGNTSGSIDGYEYRLYAVSGYQRSLIASKLYQYMSNKYLEQEPYNINKKFEFNDVKNDHSMIVYLDSLYIPGCDGVYKYGYDVPGLSSNWTRPIKYDTGAEHITLTQRQNFLNIGYRVNKTNYIGRVDERLYTSKGYIVTESIYWDKLSTRKSLEKLKIGYKNVASSVGNIKVYAMVDDDYFWRFRPSATPTNRPEIGDIYNVANNTTAKVINVDKTEGVITLVTVSNTGSYMGTANTTITKVSGVGDNSIAVGYKFDNRCLLKTITSDNQEYGSDFIFGKDFVNNNIPYWHKIQFIVELNSNDNYISPEIYEISMISDINDTVL